MKSIKTMSRGNRSVAQVRAEFARKGISIAEWARAHQVGQSLVYEVLREWGKKKKCIRGDSHRIAVLLGLKPGEIASDARDMNVVTDTRGTAR